uniref:Uncharacterized protein n=1 Tax=Peronospora matthiolae TaxID=2874970 RepID=A0AAV1UMR8_9STRA
MLHTVKAVDDDKPPFIDENERTMDPYVNDVVNTELLRLADCTSSSSERDVPVSSSGSRRKRKRNAKKGTPIFETTLSSTDNEDDIVVTNYVFARHVYWLAVSTDLRGSAREERGWPPPWGLHQRQLA